MKIVHIALEDEWSRLARLDAELESLEDQDSQLLEHSTRQTIVRLLADQLPDIEPATETLPTIGLTIGRLTSGSIRSLRIRVIELRSLHQALICHTITNDGNRAESLNPSAAYLKDLQFRLECIDRLMIEARLSAGSGDRPNRRDDISAVKKEHSPRSATRAGDPIDTLSHSVRTPLQAAKLRTELLAENLAYSEKESKELVGVLRSLDEAINILNKYTLKLDPLNS